MTPKLLANENFPLPAVRLLRAGGVDIETVLDVMPAASDEEVLAYARCERRWIVTFDRDYGDLVFRKGMPPPAVVYLRQEAYSPEKPAELVQAILAMPERWKHDGKVGQYSAAKVHRTLTTKPDGQIELNNLAGLEPEVIDGF